ARAAHEHRDHHQHEDEELLDAGHRDAVVGREPALRLQVVEDVLERPDRQADQARDPERHEPREERRGQGRHDLEGEGGRVEPNTVTVPPGSTGGCGFTWIPNARDTAAWAVSSTPRDAASLASGEAVRSGRKAMNSIAAPMKRRTTNVITSAAAVGTCTP